MSAVGGSASPDPDAQHLTRVVAVDGPAGSGKSTVARRTALALGWRFVDTGATYRAVTLGVLRSGADLRDPAAVARVAITSRVELDVDPAGGRVLLDGEDVSAEIRGAAVTAAVSAVSAVPAVRRHLVSLQRALMGRDGAVVEGRDIATVVAPYAAVKVYLDASPEVRAQRRAAEQPARGATEGRLALVEQALSHRDAMDSKTNLLMPSEGAVHLDTSAMTIDDAVAALVDLVEAAGLLSGPPGSSVPPATAPRPSEEERP